MSTPFGQNSSARCLPLYGVTLAVTLLAAAPLAACALQESDPFQNEPTSSASDDRHSPRSQSDTSWNRPRTEEAAADRREMVERQIAQRDVTDAKVLDAMRNVPRHWFVPAHLSRLAYADRPLPIGEGQTISQPYIVALMTQALNLTPQSKVLEIGTGSGYQAAVLSELTPHVFSIEIVEPLARAAIARFTKHGYGTIQTRIGDGYGGWPDHAPFDAIIVTCAPQRIPPKLLDQLGAGGRMCIPVGGEHGVQELVVVTKLADGSLPRKSLIPVRFVPMTGQAQKSGPDVNDD